MTPKEKRFIEQELKRILNRANLNLVCLICVSDKLNSTILESNGQHKEDIMNLSDAVFRLNCKLPTTPYQAETVMSKIREANSSNNDEREPDKNTIH